MSGQTEQAISYKDRVLGFLKYLWAEYSVVYAFVLIVIIASILNPYFLGLQNLVNIMRQVSVIGMVAMGMTVIIVSGGFDLSVGSVLALCGVVGMWTLNATESIPAAVLMTFAVALAAGGVTGTLIGKGKLPPFIATLGMMAIARSLALFIADGGSMVGDVSAYTVISRGDLFGLRFPIYAFVGVTIIIGLVMNKTKFGRYVYATGSNERAALLSAVNVDRVKIAAYMVGAACVAAGTVMESATLNSISSANSGQLYELDAIAICVIGGAVLGGGRAHILGTFFGVLVMGVLNNILNLMDVSPFLQGTFKGLIVILAVLVQRKNPTGK